ncbi:Secretory immunoglobulin A-binding protein EsiB [Ferriphaselus amnicola]|uniref:Secretory immunoglobulin A-binding protein EsiB n=1 Tax=Ferriphaselus amnicola TaxID=1188319 RepID=A0A2Z6GAK6_9PROT|nr:tetratricopeptide repeat protein [Ferriphaselus amnicola]BBE50454.1 Secretory immunoglobulin A-binding protein EsiB [Ferriphaselus amnicola]
MTRPTPMQKLFALLFVLFTVLARPVLAYTQVGYDAYNKGVLAYNQADYPSAFNYMRIAAEDGVAQAQYNMAAMYDNGEGVAQSKSSALYWYRKAADQGHRDSQLALAKAYENGEGVTRDATAALQWYRKAAEQGDADAQVKVGNSYTESMNYVEARRWYQLAASQQENEYARNYARNQITQIDRYERDRADDYDKRVVEARKRTQEAGRAATEAYLARHNQPPSPSAWEQSNEAARKKLKGMMDDHTYKTSPYYGTGCNGSASCR